MSKDTIINEKDAIINETEFNAVVEAASAAGSDEYTHTFAKPFSYEGKTYEKLTFRWGALTAKDSLDIENEMAALGKPLLAAEFSGEYLSRMAVRACVEKIAHNVLLAMPLGDYNKIRSRARSFLLRSGS